MDPFNFLNTFPIVRQDSNTSAGSSVGDSPIYSGLTGKLISHEDMEFQRNKEFYFNAMLRQFNPKAFAIVETANDVKLAIKYCQEHGCPLCIVSGGHSDYGTLNGAFVIKLSHMKKIAINVEEQVAFVEPGVLIGDLDVATVRHNLATPLGTASSVGLGGQALDLGMGFLTRCFGFLIDNVIEYELIAANGEQLRVNKKSHSDLFWAMKGYGANFGVTTNYKLQLHKIPPRMVGGCCYFSWHDAKAAIKHMRDFQKCLQQNNLVANAMLHIGKTSFQVFYRLLYVGNVEEGDAIVSMLLQSCPPVPLLNKIEHASYDVFQRSCDFLYEAGQYLYQSPGHFLRELGDDYIDTIVDSVSALNVKDNYCTSVYFSILGGAVKESSADSSPFLFKDANWWVGAVGSSAQKDGYQKVYSIISGMFKQLDSHAIVPDQVKMAENEIRLKNIKRKYDPMNLFKHNPCNITPD
eukprot:Seg42.6_Seg42.7 transcript_id=Seg42.6_Seg42.7/GoldUCD/mRNA.D3Y31 product="FAD-linked oxidoreductase" protein_id=Seg42.6_Seg42.7/GoldUCD/D3Y31